jgi:hypothetical protein
MFAMLVGLIERVWLTSVLRRTSRLIGRIRFTPEAVAPANAAAPR